MDDDYWNCKKIGNNVLIADKQNKVTSAYVNSHFRYRKEFIPEVEAEAIRWEQELHAQSLKERMEI